MVHSKASNAASHGETGCCLILIHIIKLMLNDWKHMEKINMISNPLLYEAMFSEMENCSHKGSWFYTLNAVIKLFCGTNSSNALDASQINQVIHNMKSSYEWYWRSQLGDPYDPSGKLSLYRAIKPAFRMERYLADVPKQIHRRALTALNAQKLEIEAGRYSRDYIPRPNRICTLCKNGVSSQTGDEFHVVMCCPSFAFALQRENLRNNVAGRAHLFSQLN